MSNQEQITISVEDMEFADGDVKLTDICLQFGYMGLVRYLETSMKMGITTRVIAACEELVKLAPHSEALEEATTHLQTLGVTVVRIQGIARLDPAAELRVTLAREMMAIYQKSLRKSRSGRPIGDMLLDRTVDLVVTLLKNRNYNQLAALLEYGEDRLEVGWNHRLLTSELKKHGVDTRNLVWFAAHLKVLTQLRSAAEEGRLNDPFNVLLPVRFGNGKVDPTQTFSLRNSVELATAQCRQLFELLVKEYVDHHSGIRCAQDIVQRLVAIASNGDPYTGSCGSEGNELLKLLFRDCGRLYSLADLEKIFSEYGFDAAEVTAMGAACAEGERLNRLISSDPSINEQYHQANTPEWVSALKLAESESINHQHEFYCRFAQGVREKDISL